MSFQRMLEREVTILSAPETPNLYGDMTRDWSNPIARAAKIWFAQQSSTDDFDHRDGTITEGLATAGLDARLAAGERVVIDGETFAVVGVPNVAHTPRGPHHIEARLKAVDG